MKKILFILISFAFFACNVNAQSCGMPAGLTSSSVTDFTANVSWGSVTGASWYNIRYRTTAGPGSWVTSTSTPTSKSLSGLTPGTQYDVQVGTRCSSGISSAYGSIYQFTTTNTCSVPSSLAFSGITTTTATISWGAVGSALWYSTRYRTSAGPGVWVTGTTTSPTRALTGLAAGTTYDFQVATNCTGGQSAYSPVFQFRTKCASIALTSTIGSYTYTQTQADGTTKVYTDSSGCALMASIQDAVGGNTLGSTTVASTLSSSVLVGADPVYTFARRNYTVTPASNGPAVATFYFYQSDFDDYNANNPSFLDLPTTGSNTDPNIPFARIAKVDGTSSYLVIDTLRWDASNSRWEAKVINANIKGTYSIFTMPDCIGVNVSGLAISTYTGTTVTPTWTAVTSPVYGWYTFRYKPTSSGTWISGGTANNGTTTKLIIGLTPNTPYELQIRRDCSNQSAGAWSSSVTFTTLNTCNTPAGVNMTLVTGTTAKINWTGVTGASFYTARYREAVGPGAWITGTSGSASKTISGLTTSTLYDVEVATNCPGWLSAYSSTIQFTTLSAKQSIFNSNNTIINEVEVYPNPTQDIVNINFNSAKGNVQALIHVLDISGRIVRTIQTSTIEGVNNSIVDLSKLEKGIYVIQISIDGNLQHASKVNKF